MTPAEIRAKFAASEVDAETYAWREGFGDWLRLGSIEDFKDLASAAPAQEEGQTRRTDAADLFARAAADEATNADAGSDLFGSTPAAASAAAKPAPASSDVFAPASSNLFGATAQAAASDSAPGPTRQPRNSAPAVAAAPAGNGEGMSAEANPKMAGQRNENSVLFSLNNLQALASSNGAPSKQGGPAPAAKAGVDNRPGFANSQTEGSGLIDIRAMAASTLAAGPSSSSSSSRGSDELPPLAAPPIFSPMAAPIMMAAPSQGMPKYMYAVLGIGGLLVVCFIVVTVLILTKKDPVVAQPPVNVPGPAVATGPAPTAVPAVPGEPKAGTPPAPAAETKTAPAVDEPKVAGSKKSGKVHSETPAAGKKPGKETVAAAPEVAPPAAKATKPKGKSELDDLLDGASPGSGKKPVAKKEEPAGGDDLPEQLGKGEIVGGMKKVSGKVADCYNQFKVPGMASVSVTIAKSGSVSSASVSGAFSGTPTGSCVERAVKSASFPKFKGSSQTITYPFVLR